MSSGVAQVGDATLTKIEKFLCANHPGDRWDSYARLTDMVPPSSLITETRAALFLWWVDTSYWMARRC